SPAPAWKRASSRLRLVELGLSSAPEAEPQNQTAPRRTLGTRGKLARLVATGLEEAHRRRVLHRDIKPDNVLVRRDESGWQAKIVDFGLALQDALPQAT